MPGSHRAPARGAAQRQIIVTGVKHNEPRVVWEQNPALVIHDVGEGGPAKAAVQDGYSGEIGSQVDPGADRGAADEYDAAEPRWGRAVGRLEGTDLHLEPGWVERGSDGRATRSRLTTLCRCRVTACPRDEQDREPADGTRAADHT
jgi:hypothetical protein